MHPGADYSWPCLRFTYSLLPVASGWHEPLVKATASASFAKEVSYEECRVNPSGGPQVGPFVAR